MRAFVAQARAAFPAPERMSDQAQQRASSRLLGSADWQDSPHRRRRLPAFLIVTATIAFVVAVYAWRVDRLATFQSAPTTKVSALAKSRAAIVAMDGARFSRLQSPPDEIVRLDEGTIDLEVTALPANERFRVTTNDGDVEVRGTRFEVVASKGSLTAVHVWRGRVEVHSYSGAVVILGVGDQWVRGKSAGAGPVAFEGANPPFDPRRSMASMSSRKEPRGVQVLPKTDRLAGTKKPLTERTVASGEKDSEQRSSERERQAANASFDRAWALLRQGNAKAAAVAFGEAQQLARGRDLEEDAFYWHAVAIARTGDSNAARSLFSGFVERFPHSDRVGEAEAALGWLLVEAGEFGGAKHAFERALPYPSPRVRATARDGLQRLSKLGGD